MDTQPKNPVRHAGTTRPIAPQTKRHLLMAGIACVLVIGSGLLLYALFAALTSRSEASATATPADPYATFTARQVIDAYVADYQKGDYAAAHRLFSAGIQENNTVDQQTRSAQDYITRYGPITTATIEMFSQQGAEAIGLIRFAHTDPNGFEQYRVVIRRENNAWKISDRGQV